MVEWDCITYEDFIECSRRYNKFLREEQKCDMVIALTHMRQPNDEKLARAVPELDLILGGHDHDYGYYCQRDEEGKQISETFMLKSGADFKELSFIELKPFEEIDIFHYDSFPLSIPCKSKGFTVVVERLFITHSIKVDDEMKKIVFDLTKEEQKKLKEKVGFLGTDMEC